ncbi:MAG: DUF2934 domain-containing protein [Rhodoplanes sp.]|jgi:hypothetical protein
MQLTLEERIRDRAYFLSESAGGGGDDTHFWLIAEREVLAEIATESATAVQVAEAIHMEAAEPVLQATETTQAAPSQPNKPARKTRPAGKTSAKSSAKSAPAAAESRTVQSGVVTPIKSATNAPVKPAITPANKARARASAR